MFRFLWPILLMFGPRLGPRIVKYARALYRLHFDSRVNVFIKFLIPLAVGYAIFWKDFIPDWIPYGLGRYDDLVILGLAIWLFWNLCPREVVREHLGDPPGPRPEDRDPDGVVDGQARPPGRSDDAD